MPVFSDAAAFGLPNLLTAYLQLQKWLHPWWGLFFDS